MFPAGYCAGLGVGGWALMIGSWVALLAVVVWAISRLFPAAPHEETRSDDQPLDPTSAVPAQGAASTDRHPSVTSPQPDAYVGAGRN
jgi:hypothetical protein